MLKKLRHIDIRIALLIVILAITAGPLAYASFYHMKINALRAEMKLMLAYIQSLQQSHRLETGRYVGFEEWYGARIKGQDYCRQPEGAARLGFILRWCHQEQAAMIRYAYRVELDEEQANFRALAHSGSDDQGKSFVCFFGKRQDVWSLTIDQGLQSDDRCL